MCDATVQSVIEQVIQAKVSKEESFTAFDITEATRDKLGRGFDIPHWEVKNEVTRMFHDGHIPSYTREQGVGYNSNIQPLVYKFDATQPSPNDGLRDDADEPKDDTEKVNFWSSLKKLAGIA